MKKILFVISTFFALLSNAQENAGVQLMVMPVQQGDTIPQNINEMLQTRLMNAVAANGATAGEEYSQFFIAGRFNHSYKETVPGPPIQYAMHTTLTLYIGDVKNKQVFASESFDLRGVGQSEERALINALNGVNARNKKMVDFVEKGKQKVVDYFDQNYESYLRQARQADSQGNTEEAIYYATLIPSNSKGYSEAESLTKDLYKKYRKQQQSTTNNTVVQNDDTEESNEQIYRKARKTASEWNKKQKRPALKFDFISFR